MELIPLFTDTGCRTGHYAARSRHPSVSPSNPYKTTPGEMLPGGVAVVVTASPETVGGRAAHAGLGHWGPLPRAGTDEQARRPWHAGRFGPVLARPGPEADDAFGDPGQRSRGETPGASKGRWHGVRVARDEPVKVRAHRLHQPRDPTGGKRRGDRERAYPGKLLATPDVRGSVCGGLTPPTDPSRASRSGER